MCEYCNLKPTADFMMKVGKQIEEDGFLLSKVFVCQTEEGYCCLLYKDYEGENHYIPIEYCPKCGKKLIEENENLEEYSFEVGV